jgi:Polyketide cyclase / dehydrase and lipid transport
MTRRRWATLFPVLLYLTHGTGAWATPLTLSADQQRRLDAGEIVLLDALPPGASESAQGGTVVAVVCAPTAVVWAILVDWRNHPSIYPHVARAEVTHADSSRVRVRYTLAIGPFSFDAHIDKYPDAARRRVEWRLAEDQPSRFFAESSGYWQVDELGAESLVTYAVATRTLVPAFLTRGSQRHSLVSTVEAVRKRATQSPCSNRAP